MRRPFLLLALLALAVPARAQSAADLYHEAARLYIGGEREAAEQAAANGLRLDPDDAKLQALLDRIRQQQDQQQQSGQGGESNQQQNPNRQGGDEGPQGNEGEQQDQQDEGTNRPEDGRDGAASDRPPEEQPPPQPSEQPMDQGREDEQPSPDAPRPGEGDVTPESATPAQPGEMSRAEAERILNAVGAEERLLLRRVQRQPGSGRRVEKDW